MGVLILEGVGGGSRLPTTLSSEPLRKRQSHNTSITSGGNGGVDNYPLGLLYTTPRALSKEKNTQKHLKKQIHPASEGQPLSALSPKNTAGPLGGGRGGTVEGVVPRRA